MVMLSASIREPRKFWLKIHKVRKNLRLLVFMKLVVFLYNVN